MNTRARARRFRAVAARVAAPGAVVLLFTSTFAAGVVLHLPLPPSRRVATRTLTSQVSRAMRGSVQIGDISSLSLRGVVARDVVILDEQGQVVLASPRVDARADLLATVLSVLPWSDHVRLHVSWVRAEHVDVRLLQDDGGTLTLATTFLAPPKPPSVPPAKPGPPARPFTIDLSAIEVGSVSARGRIGSYSNVHWDARALLGAVHAGPDGVTVDVQPFPVTVYEVLPQPLRTTVDYHFRTPELMWTSFVASFDQLTVTGSAKLDGGYLDATVDLPRTSPLAFESLLPKAVQLSDPVEGKLAVRGTLPLLDTKASVTTGDAQVGANGLLRLAPELDADLAVNVRQLDLSRVVLDGPVTQLHADTIVRMRLDEDGAPTLHVTGRAKATEMFGVSLPETHVDAVVDRKGVRGTAMLQEPGMPVSTDFSVDDKGRVQFVATANAPSLKNVPRLGGVASGYAVARLEGTYEQGRFRGDAVADVGNLGAGGVSISTGRVRAHTTASREGVHIDGSLSGSGVRAAGMSWGGVRATWRGPAQSPLVTLELRDETAPHVNASARLSLGDQLAARDVKVKLGQADEEVLASTDLIDLRGGTADFGALAIDGLGEPVDAVLRVGERGFDARVVSEGIDVDKLSRVLGVAVPAVDGQVALDVDLRSIERETHGCVRMDVRDAKVQSIGGIPVPDRVDASLRALFVGSTVDVDLALSVGGQRPASEPRGRSVGACLPAEGVRGDGLFEARVAANGTLHGPVTDPESWRGATGTARLMQLMVNLDKLDAAVVRPLRMAAGFAKVSGVPEIGGRFSAHAELVRERSDLPPGWRLAASTQGLRVAWGDDEERRRVQGADLFLTADMHDGGLLRTQMCVRDDMGAFDTEPCDPQEVNVLATLALLAELDYPRLWENPGAASDVLEKAEIDGRLAVLDRPMSNLVRPLPLEGDLPVDAERIGGEVLVRATMLDPVLGFRMQALEVGSSDASWRAPVTLCMQGQYDGTRALAHAEIRERRGRVPRGASLDALCGAQALSPRVGGDGSRFRMTPIGYVDVDVLAHWGDMVRLRGLAGVPWVANVNGIVHGFELSNVPALADAGIAGRLQAYGGIRGLGQEPQFDVMARMTQLRAGSDSVYDDGQLRLRADEGGLTGELKLQAKDDDNTLKPRLTLKVDTAQIRWQGIAPTRDGSKPVNVRLLADRFRIAMLGPFLQPVLNYVDGEVSGVARATWSPEDGQSKVHEMYLALHDGAFQVPTIGQEFLSVSGILQAAGSNRLYVEDFRAESLSGALGARATIDLDGFRIANVSAALKAEKGRKIRVTFQGIPVGDVWGNAFVSIRPSESRVNARVAFEDLHVDLSDTDLRTVQDLAPNNNIVVVPSLEATATAREKSERSGDVTPWYVTLVSRDAAQVERSGMRFSVIAPRQGSNVLQLVIPDPDSGETKLTGHLVLYDGKLDVFGKNFLLEEDEARVIFTGNPSDPALDVTARWDAPDGTRVYVDVTGSIKKPRINFRSDPAKPPSEVLALVLFGTDAAGTGTTSGGTQGGEGTAAAGVGGGVATAGLNLLLEDLSPVNVSTRIDTSSGQSASPTLVVEVSSNVTAEATYVPPTEKTLDRDDQYLLTLDWRFLRSWSLRTMMGNKGSSIVDVIWQHRY